MKKILILVLALFVIFVSGCGETEKVAVEDETLYPGWELVQYSNTYGIITGIEDYQNDKILIFQMDPSWETEEEIKPAISHVVTNPYYIILGDGSIAIHPDEYSIISVGKTSCRHFDFNDDKLRDATYAKDYAENSLSLEKSLHGDIRDYTVARWDNPQISGYIFTVDWVVSDKDLEAMFPETYTEAVDNIVYSKCVTFWDYNTSNIDQGIIRLGGDIFAVTCNTIKQNGEGFEDYDKLIETLTANQSGDYYAGTKGSLYPVPENELDN